MPIRNIDSGTWDDEWFSELSFFEQALFIALFSKCADGQGRCRDNAALLRSLAFPTKEISAPDVEVALGKFAGAWRIYRYEEGGKRLLQVLHWWRYQNPRFATPSDYPPPPGWQDHTRATIRGHLIEVNWTNPREHRVQEDAWIESHRNAQEQVSIDAHTEPSIETPYSVPQQSLLKLKAESLVANATDVGGSKSPPKPRPKEPTPSQVMFEALVKLCHVNLKLITGETRGKLNQVEKRLRENNKTPADVAEFETYWYSVDWRGQKGQGPEPAKLGDYWGEFERWVEVGKPQGGNSHGATQRDSKQPGELTPEKRAEWQAVIDRTKAKAKVPPVP